MIVESCSAPGSEDGEPGPISSDISGLFQHHRLCLIAHPLWLIPHRYMMVTHVLVLNSDNVLFAAASRQWACSSQGYETHWSETQVIGASRPLGLLLARLLCCVILVPCRWDLLITSADANFLRSATVVDSLQSFCRCCLLRFLLYSK